MHVPRPVIFFLLVFALSIPFWLIGAATGLQLAPGLPVSALMAFCPMLAAAILVYRDQKAAGVAALLNRAVDCERIGAKIWYVPVLLLAPGMMVAAYGVMRVLGMELPEPQFPIPAAVGMFVAFFIAGVGEEVGWSGYAIDPLQERWGALTGSIIVGLVWAVWHFIPLMQAHRSAIWIAFWAVRSLASRVLIVWLYNNTGKSVFAAVLFHDMSNVSWLMFPNYGSHYDPRVVAPIFAIVAVIVIVIWGPRTLAGRGKATVS